MSKCFKFNGTSIVYQFKWTNIYIYVGINYINPLDNSVLEHCDDMERSSPEAEVGSMTIKDDLEVWDELFELPLIIKCVRQINVLNQVTESFISRSLHDNLQELDAFSLLKLFCYCNNNIECNIITIKIVPIITDQNRDLRYKTTVREDSSQTYVI